MATKKKAARKTKRLAGKKLSSAKTLRGIQTKLRLPLPAGPPV